VRIWSLHPKYLDTKGLVALWRETLLAKNVLENKTKGYKNHPQLIRFKESLIPLDFINAYLAEVYKEAKTRNYSFDETKFRKVSVQGKISVTSGQIKYEMEHLKQKLLIRDMVKYKEVELEMEILNHPIFKVISGEVENWEKKVRF
jgi:hypothetical protein